MTRRLACSGCGAEFDCGALPDGEACWCTALPRLPLSAEPGADCLCRSCLEARIAAALPTSPPPP